MDTSQSKFALRGSRRSQLIEELGKIRQSKQSRRGLQQMTSRFVCEMREELREAKYDDNRE